MQVDSGLKLVLMAALATSCLGHRAVARTQTKAKSIQHREPTRKDWVGIVDSLNEAIERQGLPKHPILYGHDEENPAGVQLIIYRFDDYASDACDGEEDPDLCRRVRNSCASRNGTIYCDIRFLRIRSELSIALQLSHYRTAATQELHNAHNGQPILTPMPADWVSLILRHDRLWTLGTTDPKIAGMEANLDTYLNCRSSPTMMMIQVAVLGLMLSHEYAHALVQKFGALPSDLTPIVQKIRDSYAKFSCRSPTDSEIAADIFGIHVAARAAKATQTRSFMLGLVNEIVGANQCPPDPHLVKLGVADRVESIDKRMAYFPELQVLASFVNYYEFETMLAMGPAAAEAVLRDEPHHVSPAALRLHYLNVSKQASGAAFAAMGVPTGHMDLAYRASLVLGAIGFSSFLHEVNHSDGDQHETQRLLGLLKGRLEQLHLAACRTSEADGGESLTTKFVSDAMADRFGIGSLWRSANPSPSSTPPAAPTP